MAPGIAIDGPGTAEGGEIPESVVSLCAERDGGLR